MGTYFNEKPRKYNLHCKLVSFALKALFLQQQMDEMVYSQKEADVLKDLITFYKNLFPLTPDEMVR